MSDSCLTPIQQFFLAILWREQVTFQRDDDEVCFVLAQHASSLKQRSAGRHVVPLGHIRCKRDEICMDRYITYQYLLERT